MSELARCSVCGEEHPVATMVTGHKRPEELPEDQRPDGLAERVDWWLQDGEAMHAQHPRSFAIPPEARRRALRPGEPVKLAFVYGPHADREGEGHIERMWVRVLDHDAAGRARGRLSNRPVRLQELSIGDLVAFGPHEVISIDHTDEELGYAQDQWPIVDAAVMRDDRPPDLVARAASPRAEGEEEWWMVCREDTAGPETRSVGALTDRFPGLEEPLRAGAGLWALAGGEQAEARWRRVGEEEIAASEDWRGFLEWLAKTAAFMRDQGR